MSPDVTGPSGAAAGGRGNVSRWSIEHPYVVVAFYLGVALLSVLVIFFQMPRRMMPYVESPIVGVVSVQSDAALADQSSALAMWLRATGRVL